MSGGAWCPKTPVGPGVREWLQVDLGQEYLLTRAGTQGRYGQGRGQEYAEQFLLEYWRPGFGDEEEEENWAVYRNHTGHRVRETY